MSLSISNTLEYEILNPSFSKLVISVLLRVMAWIFSPTYKGTVVSWFLQCLSLKTVDVEDLCLLCFLNWKQLVEQLYCMLVYYKSHF